MRSIRTASAPHWLGMATLVALCLTTAPTFAAKDDTNADQRIQTATVEIKKLESDDTHKAATGELGKAEALRDKARSLIGQRRQRDALAQTLDELEATVALAGGKIVEADRQAKLDEKKAELAKLRSEIEGVKKSVDELEAEQKELEGKLGGAK